MMTSIKHGRDGAAGRRGAGARPRDARAQQPQTIRIAVVKSTVLATTLELAKHLPPGWKTELTYFNLAGRHDQRALTDRWTTPISASRSR